MKQLVEKELIVDVSDAETVSEKIEALQSFCHGMIEEMVSEETDRFFLRVRTSFPRFENF